MSLSISKKTKQCCIGIAIFILVILIIVGICTCCCNSNSHMKNILSHHKENMIELFSGSKYHSLSKNEKLQDYLKGKDAVLIAILAPWCGHCKTMKKQKLLQDVSKQEYVVELDDNHPDSMNVMKAVDSKGFPTLCIFTQGNFYPYNGQRTADAIKKTFKSRPK